MTSYGATSDHNVVKLTIFCFQWILIDIMITLYIRSHHMRCCCCQTHLPVGMRTSLPRTKPPWSHIAVCLHRDDHAIAWVLWKWTKNIKTADCGLCFDWWRYYKGAMSLVKQHHFEPPQYLIMYRDETILLFYVQVFTQLWQLFSNDPCVWSMSLNVVLANEWPSALIISIIALPFRFYFSLADMIFIENGGPLIKIQQFQTIWWFLILWICDHHFIIS